LPPFSLSLNEKGCPFHVEAKKLFTLLLQASVVGLGFGMDLQQVMQAGRSGFIYTAGSISIALLLGWGWEDSYV
jgi:uncharacterized membrane protein YadS